MADAAIEPGRILAGKYRLGERLGEGGMGAVYRATHLVLQAPVAIKVIEREIADEVTKGRFVREAQAAAALRSPHVVQILDYGTEDDFPFMVMELLEGETLAQRIKRKKRLSAQETSWILAHVGRAVAKAHELGIVHRDLKPDNVFLVHNEEDEVAKVLDFGVAKIEATSLTGDSHTRTGSLLGTPYYMSPEQAQGNKAIDHRSDLWALGVIAFECLTGKRPFASDGLGDLVLQICIRDLPVPSDVALVPIGFDAWFARAVQREPDDRFQSAKELTDALREVLGAKESHSEPAILVTSASSSVPPPPSSTPAAAAPTGTAPTEEDARPTERMVDAAAATIAEGEVPGLLTALHDARQPRVSAVGADEGQSPLSVSLHHTVLARSASGTGSAPEKPRRRSHTGVVFAVGSGALAIGVLAAVIALRDRPGFRVGDIERPEPTAPNRAGAKPSGERSKASDGTRQPAQPRATQRSDSKATALGDERDDETDAPRPNRIDGRSILAKDGEDAILRRTEPSSSAEKSDDKSPAPDAKSPEPSSPPSSSSPATSPATNKSSSASGDSKRSEPKAPDAKAPDAKATDSAAGDAKKSPSKAPDAKPPAPKPTEPSGEQKPEGSRSGASEQQPQQETKSSEAAAESAEGQSAPALDVGAHVDNAPSIADEALDRAPAR